MTTTDVLERSRRRHCRQYRKEPPTFFAPPPNEGSLRHRVQDSNAELRNSRDHKEVGASFHGKEKRRERKGSGMNLADERIFAASYAGFSTGELWDSRYVARLCSRIAERNCRNTCACIYGHEVVRRNTILPAGNRAPNNTDDSNRTSRAQSAPQSEQPDELLRRSKSTLATSSSRAVRGYRAAESRAKLDPVRQ